MKLVFLPAFLRQFKKLNPAIQEEAIEKIEAFRQERNHAHLKVHKLKGRLAGRYGFSVNFKYHVVFRYTSKDEAALLAIGDHDIYQ